MRYGIRCTSARCRRQERAHVSNPRLRHKLIGYARVSKTDGSQSLDLQRDALIAAGVDPQQVYDDLASGVRDDRPGFEHCLRALGKGDVLAVWKLDRLGRNLTHLVNTVQSLSARGVGLRVLTGQGAQFDTTAAGRLVFGIFAALAEFEGDLIRERTLAGLEAARARGRRGAGAAGSSPCRKLRCASPRPPWPTAIPRSQPWWACSRNGRSSACRRLLKEVPRSMGSSDETVLRLKGQRMFEDGVRRSKNDDQPVRVRRSGMIRLSVSAALTPRILALPP